MDNLINRGIAFIRFDDLGLDIKQWNRLREIVDDFRGSGRVLDRIEKYRAEFAIREMRGDDYIVKLYSERPTFEFDHPLLQLFLSASVLDAVNSYLGLWAKLIYVDVWHTIPGDMGRRIGSQHWHRDPEDMKMVKIYLYFSEVDLTAGPLEYLPGSNRDGPYGKLWRWRALEGPRRYRSEEELQRTIPQSECISCVGSQGTLIFCDTSGFHRGGVATTGARIVATCTFVTAASLSVLSQRRFVVNYRGKPNPSPAVLFALN